MTPHSTAVSDAAARLWARAAGEATAPSGVAAAADLMCTMLRAGLGRWIGATGYRALLERALAETRPQHPALDEITCLGGEAPAIEAAVREQGAGRLSAGLLACVGEIIELLGRIIGPEMAVQLVDQIDVTSPRGVMGARIPGGLDGDKARG